MDGDLISDPAVEHLAENPPDEAALSHENPRTGGDPQACPRSLTAAELDPDDESLASQTSWDLLGLL